MDESDKCQRIEKGVENPSLKYAQKLKKGGSSGWMREGGEGLKKVRRRG